MLTFNFVFFGLSALTLSAIRCLLGQSLFRLLRDHYHHHSDDLRSYQKFWPPHDVQIDTALASMHWY
jgi:predicted xylose isomerase-like sugar epimerase